VANASKIEFITVNRNLKETLNIAKKVAKTLVPVLIQGESGTGKELIANIIHSESERKNAPLISVNCGSLSPTLILSELFGYEKGSFTGANQTKKGIFECAAGGTIFLDEIGEMGLEAQGKILRFLENGEITRVGGHEPIKVNARTICATNKNLEEEVNKNRFRKDLFYRINTVTLTLEPLRLRKEDIPLLINHFMKNSSIKESVLKEFGASAIEILTNYYWPGNVRELKNFVEQCRLLAKSERLEGKELLKVINFYQKDKKESIEDVELITLEEIEKRHIFRVLKKLHGNKSKAAKTLGISLKTLYNKLTYYEKADNFYNELNH